MISNYLTHSPEIDPTAWVHSSAVVCGQIVLGPRVSIWPTAVLRGDQGGIVLGADSNIQDGAVVHCTGGLSTTSIGERVTVGHRAVIHGCTVEDDCLIGMGSIVMDNAVIGRGSVVGAGAVVLANVVIPPDSLVLGSPASRTRETSDAHRNWIEHSWKTYVQLQQEHRTG